MAEVLRSFDVPAQDVSGMYHARAVGRQAPDGLWEGWLEFVPIEPRTSNILVSPVESRQPERWDLVYWANGLTTVYVEGSLARARLPLTVRTRLKEAAASTEPARRMVVNAQDLPVTQEAVLDPFDVGSRSLDILAQELTALNRARLFNIISAYSLNPAGADISWMTDAQLNTFIVTAVDAQMKVRR